MTENNEEKRGMGEALKELMGKLFSNFKHLFKAIVNKFANNKEVVRKLGVLQEELENLENIVHENSDMSEERMNAMIDCISRLNDRIADFSPDNIDQFVEDVQKQINETYDILNETFVLRTNQVEEALNATIPAEHQNNYKVFVVPEKETGKMRAILSTGADSHETTYEITREGNYCKFVQIKDEELEKLAWGQEKPAGGKSLAAKVQSAYETCYKTNKNDAEIRIENLQNLIDVIKEAKENGIERDGYKFTYDKEQTTFTCEKEDGSKLILQATPESLTAYYQKSAEDPSDSVFVINRTEENGKIKNECAFHVPLSLTEKVNELLNIPEVNTVLRAFHGEKLPDDIEQSSNAVFNTSKLNLAGVQRINILQKKIEEQNENLKIRNIEENNCIAIQLSLRGSKETYSLTFTPDGKHIGYDFTDSNGNSAIISPSGGVIDSVVANNESFKKISAIVQKAMNEVNKEIRVMQNMTEEERESLTEDEKQLMSSGTFHIASPKVSNSAFALIRADRIKGFDTQYNEESLRKKMGDKGFELSLNAAKTVIQQIEALTVSPDGETEGYYKEIRSMPDDARQMLAEGIGKAITDTCKYFHPINNPAPDYEEARMLVHLAYQQSFSENAVPHQITTETIERAFATAYAEAVSQPPRNNVLVGANILKEIMNEQNLLNHEYYNEISFKESELIEPEEIMEQVQPMNVPEQSEKIPETKVSETDSPADVRKETYDTLIDTIANYSLLASAPFSELESKLLETMEKTGLIHKEDGNYQLSAEIQSDDYQKKYTDTFSRFQSEFMHTPLNTTISNNDNQKLEMIKHRLQKEYLKTIKAQKAGEHIEDSVFEKTVENFLQNGNAYPDFSTEIFANKYARSEIGFNMLSVQTMNLIDAPPTVPEQNDFSAETSLPALLPEFEADYAEAMMNIKMSYPDLEQEEMEMQMIASGWGDYAFNEEIYRKIQQFGHENKMHCVENNGEKLPVVEAKGHLYNLQTADIRSNTLQKFMKEAGFADEKAVQKSAPERPVVAPQAKEKQEEKTDSRENVSADEYQNLKAYIREGAKDLLIAASEAGDFSKKCILHADAYLEKYDEGTHHALKTFGNKNSQMLNYLFEKLEEVVDNPKEYVEITGDMWKGKEFEFSPQALAVVENIAEQYLEENYKTAETPEKTAKQTEYPEMD